MWYITSSVSKYITWKYRVFMYLWVESFMARPDCQTGCLQTEMRPLMHECFDLLRLKSERGPLPAMERVHYHSIPSLIFSSLCPPVLPLALFSLASPVFPPVLFSTAHPLKHLSPCAIHHLIKGFLIARTINMSHTAIQKHFRLDIGAQSSFQCLKWIPGHCNLGVFCKL